VSQHLRRPRHDYRQVWRTFTERTSRQLDQTGFCEAVVRWASETFNALSVTLWLVEKSKAQFTLGASTSVAGLANMSTGQHPVDASRTIQMLGRMGDPIDLDQARGPGSRNFARSIRISSTRGAVASACRWLRMAKSWD